MEPERSDQWEHDKKDYHRPFPMLSKNSYFRRGGDTPKVHMPYYTVSGRLPRKLAIERFVLFVCLHNI